MPYLANAIHQGHQLPKTWSGHDNIAVSIQEYHPSLVSGLRFQSESLMSFGIGSIMIGHKFPSAYRDRFGKGLPPVQPTGSSVFGVFIFPKPTGSTTNAV
jgi:hypothetical protein